MRHSVFTVLSAALFVCCGFGQTTSTRVFQFAHTESSQDFQEVATLVRALAGIKTMAADGAEKTLTVEGTADQIGLAEWLASELDTPANATAAKHEYTMAGGAERVARIFYLSQPLTPQSLQEIATLARSISDVRRIFIYHAPRAIVLRGTAEQAALVEWLLQQLDQPDSGAFESPEYRMPLGPENTVRMFFLKRPTTVQSFQEVVTLVRSITDTRRVFTFNAPRAVAARGTSDQLALAEWLFQQFEKAPQAGTTAARAYPAAPDGDDSVRVIYVPGADTPGQLQEIATNARTQSNIRRLFIYNAPRAIVVRGTADQTERAERIIAAQAQQ